MWHNLSLTFTRILYIELTNFIECYRGQITRLLHFNYILNQIRHLGSFSETIFKRELRCYTYILKGCNENLNNRKDIYNFYSYCLYYKLRIYTTKSLRCKIFLDLQTIFVLYQILIKHLQI